MAEGRGGSAHAHHQVGSGSLSSAGTDNWKAIAERLYEENPKKRIFRTAKQCREHWSCYLNPAIKKGPWEREEDRKLLQIVLDSNCLKKWSLIKQ